MVNTAGHYGIVNSKDFGYFVEDWLTILTQPPGRTDPIGGNCGSGFIQFPRAVNFASLYMFLTPVRLTTKATNPVDWNKSTEDTVQSMRALVRGEVYSPIVRAQVADILSKYNQPTEQETACAIWYWIARNVDFRTDEEIMQAMGIDIFHPTKELLIAPSAMLQMETPMGDCDDFTDLCNTMLTISGIPCAFVVVAADDSVPGKWSHVYSKAYFHGGGSLPLDCSHGLYPGWETEHWSRKKEWTL